MSNLKISVLSDNHAAEGLKEEWGFSALIEADGHKVLLDAGASSLFAENAEIMGVDLTDVEMCVLSHAHFDHADGLGTFFEINDHAPLYLRSGIRENCWTQDEEGNWKYIGVENGLLEEFHDRLIAVPKEQAPEILPNVYVVPHSKTDYVDVALKGKMYTRVEGVLVPDSFTHEQSLVFVTEAGYAIFNSCSHVGMRDIIAEVKAALDDKVDASVPKKVFAYVGGLHLFPLTDADIVEAADYIESEGVEKIYTGHCTGDHAMEMLQSRFGDRVEPFYAGLIREL